MKKLISFLSLFTSFSTLVCCSIPALLVSLGLGASFASFISMYPQFIWLSENKTALFIFAGLMLILTFVLQSRSAVCPVDSKLKTTCEDSKKISKYIIIFSTFIYFIGIFFAYLAPILFY